jgi:hypothetical protein
LTQRAKSLLAVRDLHGAERLGIQPGARSEIAIANRTATSAASDIYASPARTNVAACALANKLAGTAWAIRARGKHYEPLERDEPNGSMA